MSAWRPGFLLLLACLTLQELSREVVQATAPKIERVRVREWCESKRHPQDTSLYRHLDESTRLFVDGLEVGARQQVETLWPRAEPNRPWFSTTPTYLPNP
jgi:hypothetical protein